MALKMSKIKPFSASYNGYERDISSIYLIVDDRVWFHSVIQTGDLPSFLQILQIPMSSLLARKIYVFFYSSLKSVLLGGFSLISNKCIICTTRRCGGGFNAHWTRSPAVHFRYILSQFSLNIICEKFQVAALLLLILTLTKPPNMWKSECLFLGRYTVELFTHFKARAISQTSRFDIPS